MLDSKFVFKIPLSYTLSPNMETMLFFNSKLVFIKVFPLLSELYTGIP